ncbi:MAG: hypothetical protein O3B73_00845 [bacterium]|nr:hypothetical protein [bacterium]
MHFRTGILVATLLAAIGVAEAYPPSEGFHLKESDAEAMAVADEVMDAMGGWENWNKTRYITWRFFGGRLHVWDKWTGDIRFEQGELTVLMNINTRKGKVYRNGVVESQADSIEKYLDRGYKSWVNDSYWLIMPYKLKDSGVTLKYTGEEALTDGSPTQVLTLTFENVGVTPQNMYHVYVDKATHLVAVWAFYPKASDPEPRFRGPWENWAIHGKIMIADGHGLDRNGEPRRHTDIAVFDALPDAVFHSPEAVDMMAFPRAK